MRLLLHGAAAGALAGLMMGSGETMLVARAAEAPGWTALAAFWVAAAGLYAVPCAVIGAVLACLVRALPLGRMASLAGPAAPRLALAAVVVLPSTMAVLFRLAHHFSTSYRNKTLAALAMAVVALVVLVMACAAMLAAFRAARVVPGTKRPLLLAALLLLAITVPPLSVGPTGALRGPFGFIGLFAMDALDLRVPGLALMALAGGTAWGVWLARRSTRTMAALAVAAGVLELGGAFALGLPAVRRLTGTEAPALRRLVGPLDRMFDHDRDGYARALGGGDCDDRDPAVNPAASDVPGNGRDEDCDGEDLTLTAEAPAAPAPSAPTVQLPRDLSFLVITVDALNTDVGFLGYRRFPTTPNLDRLAARSVVYERAYSLGTYTAQSLPPMMAGRYPSELRRTSAHEVRYYLDNSLLAETLKANGFATNGGASHFLFAPLFGWTQGFDRFKDTGSEGDAPAGSHVDLRHSSRLLANDLIRQLQDPQRTSGRFFFWYHFLDPHKQYLEHHEFRFGGSNRALYDGELAYTDLHIGRVLDALQAAGLAERTVVIVTGDHGEAFGEHGSYFHGRETWDEIVHVPLVIHVPGLAARQVRRRVSHIDLYPTILALAGLEVPREARGQSLVPELAGADLADRPILIEQPRNPYYRMRRVFIDGGYKLHHLVEERAFRLFHLDQDPSEEHDLAAQDPERLAEVRRAYARFVATHVTSVEPVDVAPATATRSDPGE